MSALNRNRHHASHRRYHNPFCDTCLATIKAGEVDGYLFVGPADDFRIDGEAHLSGSGGIYMKPMQPAAAPALPEGGGK